MYLSAKLPAQKIAFGISFSLGTLRFKNCNFPSVHRVGEFFSSVIMLVNCYVRDVCTLASSADLSHLSL